MAKQKGGFSSRGKKVASKKHNPFEIHINRQKHKVVGQKLKNEKGLPGVSRARALKKRKATLLQEYKYKNKANKFLDRRIGEKNSTMSNEDRIMARFAAEQTKGRRKTIFNLGDDEVLTHKGHTLNEIEKFDDPRSDDEDEDGGKLEASFVGDAHFGGGFLRKAEPDEDAFQSRQNLIQQLIIESKKRKAEKQRESEKAVAMTEKLDADWKELQSIVLQSKANMDKDDAPETRGKIDSYDKAVREMKFESRGKPSDRLKSEEELASAEKKRLEMLEMERVKRMHGNLECFATKKHRSADDLDDR
ncbi:hypothetical protein B566_EDAN015128 [Ephemera danica]|nr:hypothetical protein B566_EDAN015128 [Ephemera danica]